MAGETNVVSHPQDDEKSRALANYRRRLVDYREVEQRLKELRKKVRIYFLFIASKSRGAIKRGDASAVARNFF